MINLVVTGGIGTGKSTASRLLAAAVPGAHCFDADAAVHTLLTKSEVVRKITNEFGSSVIEADGSVSRSQLRETVFGCTERRERLEAILHPLVLERCLEAQSEALRSGADLFLADIPLYFEAKRFDVPDVTVVVVATDRATQLLRLLVRSNISRQMAEMIIDTQLPLEAKMKRADMVLWNAGSRATLDAQARLVAGTLTKA